MKTRHPCYIVAELPEPIRSEVQAIRDDFASITATLPVEITLAGSSGLGPIPAGTDLSLIVAQVDAVFSAVCPFKVAFSRIASFPNTSIVYLTPLERTRFDELHDLLRHSEIPFSPSRFPYNPHCTLRAGSALPPEEVDQLTHHAFPNAPFLIDTISVYDLDPTLVRCNLLHQTSLNAEQDAAADGGRDAGSS